VVHEAGLSPGVSLDAWRVCDGAPKIVGDLNLTTAPPDDLAPTELAGLDLRVGGDVSRTDRLRFLVGYLGPGRSRPALRALVTRILAVRELAS
jgi:hypothetical protein